MSLEVFVDCFCKHFHWKAKTTIFMSIRASFAWFIWANICWIAAIFLNTDWSCLETIWTGLLWTFELTLAEKLWKTFRKIWRFLENFWQINFLFLLLFFLNFLFFQSSYLFQSVSLAGESKVPLPCRCLNLRIIFLNYLF